MITRTCSCCALAAFIRKLADGLMACHTGLPRQSDGQPSPDYVPIQHKPWANSEEPKVADLSIRLHCQKIGC